MHVGATGYFFRIWNWITVLLLFQVFCIDWVFFKKSDFFEHCPSVWCHISTQVVAITILLLSEIALRAQQVQSTWIQRGHYVDMSKTNLDEFPRHFRVLFWCNFDGRKIHVASTYFFGRNFAVREIHVISTFFFDVISMVEKSSLFPSNFISVISLVENSAFFLRTFFDVISMAEKSTFFPRTFFDVISMVEICTLFLLTFFDVILMDKN